MAETKIKPKAQKTGVEKTSNRAYITPIQLMRIAQDALTRKQAIAEAEYAYWPYRYKMQQMYLNTVDNGHISAAMERRRDLTLLRKFEIVNGENVDDATSLIFCDLVKGKLVPKKWFSDFISYSLDSIFFGYSLIFLNDIIAGAFPKIEVVKRWNVSPDRYEVTQFPYMIYGCKFLEDKDVKDWYVYVQTTNNLGTSPCGYGLLYDLSILEIFLRNLLGFNGSFVELFSQPFRWGKTHKTKEDERQAFAEMLQNIGSSGWGMGDPEDDIEFKETTLGGTGYKGYDNLEARLQKVVSKLVLGHADALDSTPGKLGSSDGKNSPVHDALRDKQTKDGGFIENVVNTVLIPKLRDLGFNIPLEAVFTYKNDAEVMDYATALTALAKDMKSGGLQMEAKYFTEQTGIPTEKIVAPQPPGAPPIIKDKKTIARLQALYRHGH